MNGCLYFYLSHFFLYILNLINKSRSNGKLPLNTLTKTKRNALRTPVKYQKCT